MDTVKALANLALYHPCWDIRAGIKDIGSVNWKHAQGRLHIEQVPEILGTVQGYPVVELSLGNELVGEAEFLMLLEAASQDISQRTKTAETVIKKMLPGN